MKLVENVRVEIGYTMADVHLAVAKKMNINVKQISDMTLVKESLDARRKPDVYYSVNVACNFATGNKYTQACKDIIFDFSGVEAPIVEHNFRPVVVGFGPSGMFAALKLAKANLRPIVIEMGESVDDRMKSVEAFWKSGKLNTASNVHFGEGGAGTFSDGKLNSNINNSYCKTVINEFIKQGAPREIFYKSKPHIGTDNLRAIVKNIRQTIIDLGGEVRFNTKLTDIDIANGAIKGVKVRAASGAEETIATDLVVLAIGHSAKSTFKLLQTKNVAMEQKPFAMGVRIEQKQADINLAQYGKVDNRLPAADYKLVEHLDNGRSVFTFCMCPGGVVVGSSSEEKTIVTNGMSYYARNLDNANAALLVNIEPSDYDKGDVLDGFDYQYHYEHLAYQLGGGNYAAPIESVGDFVSGATDFADNPSHIKPTYLPSVKYTDISKCLPDFVAESIRLALPRLDRKIKGFANPNNILTAIESKSSCPVRIVRMNELATNIVGLYAVGEGAGYAGGIMSSAQDGLKIAERIIENVIK